MNPIFILVIAIGLCGFLQWANYRADANLPIWPFHKKKDKEEEE